jgi:hypothetical protein
MKNEGLADEMIARITKLPLEKVYDILSGKLIE